jgi:hypothetical protein
MYSIFPSLEPDTGVNIPIPSSSGSLPDLTSVQFPTPLTTPLDGDEQSWSQLAAATGQTDILSQALLQQQHEHVGALRANSPSSRRRHTQGSSTPLIIHGNLVQMRQGVSPQVSQNVFVCCGLLLIFTVLQYIGSICCCVLCHLL